MRRRNGRPTVSGGHLGLPFAGAERPVGPRLKCGECGAAGLYSSSARAVRAQRSSAQRRRRARCARRPVRRTGPAIAYVIARGYLLAAIFRDWVDVDLSLSLNRAQVVVARNEHRGDRPAEVVGERTQIIDRDTSAVGRCSVERSRNELAGVYRSGYADGFLDCLTLRRNHPPEMA